MYPLVVSPFGEETYFDLCSASRTDFFWPVISSDLGEGTYVYEASYWIVYMVCRVIEMYDKR